LGEGVFVVFNPRAGKGRGAGLLEPLLRALSRDGAAVEHAVTSRAGEEGALAEAALGRGFRTLVAVGGDGTWCNVGNAILRSGLPARLGLVAGGTGCDLAKSLAIPAAIPEAAAAVIRGGITRTIDVGRVEDRYFLNVAGFGFDIAVIEHSWGVRLPGWGVYPYCALRQIVGYPGFPVDVSADGAPSAREELLMLVVANARIFGGGFRIAPAADLEDGRLDVVSFRNMGTWRRLAVMAALLRGTHGGSAEVGTRRTQRLRLRFERPPAYETDGEWNQAGSTELVVECIPRALAVLVPASSRA